MPTEKSAKKHTKLYIAYERYLNKEKGSRDCLYRAVLDYAYRKVHEVEDQFASMGSSNTADDWAQEIAIKVWQGLNERERNWGEFHAWFRTICYRSKVDAVRELTKQRRKQVPFFYQLEDEEENDSHKRTEKDIFTEENPAIHEHFESQESPRFVWPRCVQGVDKRICLHILAGHEYKEIAEMMGIAEQTIKNRMGLLKKKVAAEREAEKAVTRAYLRGELSALTLEATHSPLKSVQPETNDNGDTNPSLDSDGEPIPAFTHHSEWFQISSVMAVAASV